MNMNKLCVIIPIYKNFNQLSDFEKFSLLNCKNKLSKYAIYVLCPENIEEESYKNLGLSIIKIENKWFRSVNTYNDLMLTPYIYELFKEFDYMLISQLDSYIFNDNIEEFITLGYDYIGCLHTTPHTGNALINGNGGLSLRKIKSFITAAQHIKKDLNNKWDWEDILYSYWYKDKLNVAPDSVSLKFGWQQRPEECLIKNNQQLPFGCHKPFVFWSNFKSFI